MAVGSFRQVWVLPRAYTGAIVATTMPSYRFRVEPEKHHYDCEPVAGITCGGSPVFQCSRPCVLSRGLRNLDCHERGKPSDQ